MACPSHGTMGLPNVTYCCIREAEEPNHCGTCSSSCRTGSCSAGPRPSGPRYTKALLCQTLQLLGCKPRHSEKACAKVFLILQQRAALAPSEQYSLAPTLRTLRPGTCSVTLTRAEFEHLVLESLAPHDPSAALFSDLPMACSLQERRRCVTILLCGTSGTGKSTLASLLASRFGISTVVSTDSIRHMLRGFAALEDQPLLWTSTYQAGAALAQREKPPSTLALGAVNGDSGEKHAKVDGDCGGDEEVDVALAVEGYTRQSEAVMGSVERLVAASEARRESSILEGVHLSPALAVRLMAKHPSVVPFLIHISNEAKHLERFAVRAKAMTLRPEGNRYVRHLRAIRAIQAHLSSAAARHAVPEVDNTNVDRSVATIHATVLGCLRRQAAGTPLVHAASEQCRPVLEEYLACKSAKWSGTDMLELIRKKAAAGEAPSPPDAPSTSAASTAATPKIGLTRSLSLGAPPPSGAAGEQKGHVPVPVAVQVPVSNGQQAPQHPAEQGGAIEEEDCDDGRSFHGDGANSSEDGEGEEGEKGSEGGSGTAGHALQKVSDFGSVLELEDGRSEAG